MDAPRPRGSRKHSSWASASTNARSGCWREVHRCQREGWRDVWPTCRTGSSLVRSCCSSHATCDRWCWRAGPVGSAVPYASSTTDALVSASSRTGLAWIHLSGPRPSRAMSRTDRPATGNRLTVSVSCTASSAATRSTRARVRRPAVSGGFASTAMRATHRSGPRREHGGTATHVYAKGICHTGIWPRLPRACASCGRKDHGVISSETVIPAAHSSRDSDRRPSRCHRSRPAGPACRRQLS